MSYPRRHLAAFARWACAIGALTFTVVGHAEPRSGPGDPATGAQLIRDYGCGTCHRIPGITGADGTVGPPLNHLAKRAYLGGVLPNQPAEMVRWLLNPQAVDPRSAMPNVGLDERMARDIAAYLATLE